MPCHFKLAHSTTSTPARPWQRLYCISAHRPVGLCYQYALCSTPLTCTCDRPSLLALRDSQLGCPSRPVHLALEQLRAPRLGLLRRPRLRRPWSSLC